jgi:hypothetical protein
MDTTHLDNAIRALANRKHAADARPAAVTDSNTFALRVKAVNLGILVVRRR